MFAPPNHFQPLYDEKRKLIGVWLSPELWAKAEDQLSPAIDNALEALCPQPEPPEPIKDWELLAQYWDCQYPMPTDVHCEQCGCDTPDWQTDNPRKFRLRSASVGGLVNFECAGCKSRILKRHFKKHIDVECRPPFEK